MPDLITQASQFRVGGDGKMNTCCKKPENMKAETQTSRRGLFMRICRVCDRRHFRMIAEPGRMGVAPG